MTPGRTPHPTMVAARRMTIPNPNTVKPAPKNSILLIFENAEISTKISWSTQQKCRISENAYVSTAD